MSIILGPSLLKLYKLFINLAYFTRSVPFKWCEREDGVYYVESSRLNPFKWDVMKYVVLANQLYITVRLGQLILEMPPEQHISSLIPQFTYVFSYLVPTITQISLMHQGRSIQSLTHHFIMFSKNFQDRYSKRAKRQEISPPWQRVAEIYLILIIVAALFLELAGFIYIVKFPTEKMIISSFLFPEYEFKINSLSTWWPLPIFALINGTPSILAFTCTMVFAATGLISVSATIFISEELKCNKHGSIYTKKSLRKPWTYLYIYKMLSILESRLNGITRKYLLLFINNLVTSMSVGCQVLYITFRSQLQLEARVFIFILAVGSTIYMIVIYRKLGVCNEVSQKTVFSWKAFGGLGLGMNKNDIVLFKKYILSQKSFRVDIGDFGYYRKATSVRIIGKLIYYTSKGLMLIRKIV